MLPRAAALAATLVLFSSVPALANDPAPPPPSPGPSETATVIVSETVPPVPAWDVSRTGKRPVALSALYGSYGTLQVLDVVSTRKAVAAGAREANPLMGSGTSARAVAVKAAGTAISIYLAERMWKKNRVGAVVTMAIMNGISAAAVAHNARLATRRP